MTMKHKYGLFEGGVAQPLQEFDGDSMHQDGDHVKIFRDKGAGKTEQVGAIKLSNGQCVKEIS